MVLVEDAFGKYLGYEDETLINEIVPFNRCSRKIHGPFHHVKTQQKTLAMNQKEGTHHVVTL